ncbi:short-chain dehydrogenase/reductase SDR [Streptomyces niveus]|uniref:short-chain dehydrogenase/reductase SDR n=1 Tax=Streptomyces niveus TaxID=193462 RepID=UPI0036D41F14
MKHISLGALDVSRIGLGAMSMTSTTWPEPTIDDYAERTTATVAAWKAMNGQQSGDPAKLARALLTITDQDKPPLRFVAGADAIEGVTAKAQELLAQAEASRELGANLGHDDTVSA